MLSRSEENELIDKTEALTRTLLEEFKAAGDALYDDGVEDQYIIATCLTGSTRFMADVLAVACRQLNRTPEDAVKFFGGLILDRVKNNLEKLNDEDEDGGDVGC